MRVLGGKYRLVRQIASGGMGTVWLAEHTQLGSNVAVKLMAPQLVNAPPLRTRFEREARSAAQLKGPNVVTIHDFGVEGDTPYIVMEYLEGEDLAARLRKVGAMAPSFVVSIIDGAARALERAHELGIVHRDLKPSNVFLAREGGSEIVKVLDFGVAKNERGMLAHEGDVTSASDSLIGSPSYMSPEQIRNAKSVDHRADLWSMGVLAYRMLTKQLPFQGEGSGDLLVRVCTEPFPPVRTYQTNLPVALDGFFARALAKDPGQRFNSARELSNALAGALGLAVPSPVGALPQAKTPPPPPPSRRGGTFPPASAPGAAMGRLQLPLPPATPAPPQVSTQVGYPMPPSSGPMGSGSMASGPMSPGPMHGPSHPQPSHPQPSHPQMGGYDPYAQGPPQHDPYAAPGGPAAGYDNRGVHGGFTPTPPPAAEGDPSHAGSVQTSPGRTRQASLASLSVIVVSALCVAMIGAFFVFRGEDSEPARAPEPGKVGAAAPESPPSDPPAATAAPVSPDSPEASAPTTAGPAPSASAAAPPEVASAAPSSTGVMLDLDTIPDGTSAPPPTSRPASPPAGPGPGPAKPRPPPSAPAPAASGRLDLGL